MINPIQKPFLYFSKKEVYVAIGLFLILWTYLFARAIYVPVLHDEIATFFYYIQPGSFLPPNAHWDANNHLLNSFLSTISYQLFGSSPLALRLPNVLSFSIYFYAAFQIASRIKGNMLRWALLLAFVCSHYIFEYFGESRGYGLSMAFLLLGLHFYMTFTQKKSKKYALLTILALFLGTSANLSLIICSAIVISSMGLLYLSDKTSTVKHKVSALFLLLFTSLPFLYLVNFSFGLKEKGALYYGGTEGLYEITLKSTLHVFIGQYSDFLGGIIVTLFFLLLLSTSFQLSKNDHFQLLLKPSNIFQTLLLTSVISIYLMYFILAINFPEDRAAMHLVLFFIGGITFASDQLNKKIGNIMGIFLFYFPLYFLLNLSIRGSVFSSEERTSTSFYTHIQAANRDSKFPVTVGGYQTQEFCWYYMNHSTGGTEGKLHKNNHQGLDADFQIVRKEKLDDTNIFNYYNLIEEDQATKLMLFERKKRLAKSLLTQTSITAYSGSDEFYNLCELNIDTLVNKTLYIGGEFTLAAEKKPFVAWLAASVFDEEGNALYQEYIALDWLRKNYDGKVNNVLQGTLLHNIPKKAKTLKFYIWNIDKSHYTIPAGNCYLYQLERDFPNQ
jgi:hypothetical protein